MKGDLFKLWNRSEEGPMMTEKDFDLKIYWPTLKKLVKKHGLQYNPDEVVPQSIDEIDAVFKAAKELVIECGFYNSSTRRRVMVTEAEIDEVLYKYPKTSTVGEGKDTITFKHRSLHEPTKAHCLGRVLGPQDPALIDRVFLAYCMEARLDHICFQGIISEINGADVKPWSPAEISAEMKRVAEMNHARRRSGRAGVSDFSSAPISLQAAMSTMNADSGMRKGDVRHVYFMPHLKTSYEQFTRVMSTFAYGHHHWGIGQAYIGGLAGGPNSAAVVACAELIGYVVLYNPSALGLWCADNMYFATTSRTALYASFRAGAAWNNNTDLFSLDGAPYGVVASGPCTDTYFYEHAAAAIGNAVCGINTGGGTGWQSGKFMGATPIGARFASEVCDTTCESQIGFEEANRLVNYCLDKYQDRMEARTLHEGGLTFDKCYDVESCLPLPEYTELYEKIKADLRKEGLNNLI